MLCVHTHFSNVFRPIYLSNSPVFPCFQGQQPYQSVQKTGNQFIKHIEWRTILIVAAAKILTTSRSGNHARESLFTCAMLEIVESLNQVKLVSWLSKCMLATNRVEMLKSNAFSNSEHDSSAVPVLGSEAGCHATPDSAKNTLPFGTFHDRIIFLYTKHWRAISRTNVGNILQIFHRRTPALLFGDCNAFFIHCATNRLAAIPRYSRYLRKPFSAVDRLPQIPDISTGLDRGSHSRDGSGFRIKDGSGCFRNVSANTFDAPVDFFNVDIIKKPNCQVAPTFGEVIPVVLRLWQKRYGIVPC